MLQTAIRSFNKAKEYNDAFTQYMTSAGEALKSHDCAREEDAVDGGAANRDRDARGAEGDATGALAELAG